MWRRTKVSPRTGKTERRLALENQERKGRKKVRRKDEREGDISGTYTVARNVDNLQCHGV